MIKASKHRLPSLKGGKRYERRYEHRQNRFRVRQILKRNPEDEAVVPSKGPRTYLF